MGRYGHLDGVVYDCLATGSPEFAQGHTLSSAKWPWMGFSRYNKYPVYFATVLIFVVMVLRILNFVSDRQYRSAAAPLELELSEVDSTTKSVGREQQTSSRNSDDSMPQVSVPKSVGNSGVGLFSRLAAFTRYIGYRRFPAKVSDLTGFPGSVGASIIIGASWVYLLGWTFSQRPYYKACSGFGSPPLALRAGLIANALTPYIYAMSGKINIITCLTGISYEKLNVYHRTVSWMSLCFSLVHGIAFLVQPMWEGGSAWLSTTFFGDGSTYINGVVALVFLFVLCFFSIKTVRDRYYETFLMVHWPVGLAYLGILFWHDDGSLQSWGVLWASIGVLLSGYVYRYFYKTNYLQLRGTWFSPDTAIVRPLEDNAVNVTVFSSNIERWRPGQHMFLRFPSIQPLGNHPFSVCTLPDERMSDVGKLRFVMRPHNGLTKQVYERAVAGKATDSSEFKVLLDGPYGGLTRDLYAFDDVVLVCSGSGATAIIPFLTDLAAKLNRRGFAMATHKVRVCWVVRNAEAYSWFRDDIENALSLAPPGSVEVSLFITGECPEPPTITDVNVELGRPNIGALLQDWSRTFGRRTVVIASGVKAMNCDVGNAVAGLQRLVLLGSSNEYGGRYEEIAMHTEMFGW